MAQGVKIFDTVAKMWTELKGTDGAANVQLTGSSIPEEQAIPMKRVGTEISKTLLAAATRTTSAVSPVQANKNARGVLVVLLINSASGTGGLQVTVETYGPSGENIRMNALPTAITVPGRYGFILYPGASATAIGGSAGINQYTPAPLPYVWGVRVTHGDGSSYNYSVEYSYIA